MRKILCMVFIAYTLCFATACSGEPTDIDNQTEIIEPSKSNINKVNSVLY